MPLCSSLCYILPLSDTPWRMSVGIGGLFGEYILFSKIIFFRKNQTALEASCFILCQTGICFWVYEKCKLATKHQKRE